MTLDDIGLYSEPTQAPTPHEPLHVQSRCVCALIRRFLPRLKNDNAWKINVYVRSDGHERLVSTHDGITSVGLRRDVGAFFSLSDQDKKLFAYETLREGAAIISGHHGWPTNDILQAFDRALERKLVNEWQFQPKWNPSRRLRAYVRCAHEIGCFRAWMEVENREGGLVAKQHLFDEYPSEFCFVPRLGRVRWIDKSTVRLSDKSGQRVGEDLEVHATRNAL